MIYFRKHRWQRRVLTVLSAAILGVIAAWLAWPAVRDMQIIESLGSPDPLRRERGIARAVAIAGDRPQLIERIEAGLDSAGDLQFAAMVDVLSRLGLFRTPGRSGEQLDRFGVVNFAAGGDQQSAEVRQILLHTIIVEGRDNKHVRRALELASRDAEPDIRSAAAILAARLGEDRTLLRLLGDTDGRVRAAAAIDAALAGRTGCIKKIAGLFEESKNNDELAAVAYALARLAPEQYGEAIAGLIERAWQDGRDALLERLLYAVRLLDNDISGPAVLKILKYARGGKIGPQVMLLVTAGRIRFDRDKRPGEKAAAAAFVGDVINGLLAEEKDKLTLADAQVLAAAVNAARRLGLGAGATAEAVKNLWHPGTSLAMILAAEAIAEMGPRSAPPNVSVGSELSREQILEILERAAAYEGTPVPSAAAAAAMFRLAPDRAYEAVRTVCESDNLLAGDYLAWNLARAPAGGADKAEAWRLAAVLFGPGVYNKAVRSTGAILLALLARRTDRAEDAARAIEARLKAEIRSAQRDPFTESSYLCALLMLGRSRFAGEVVALAESEAFGRRRALTALALAGEPEGFDLVFAAKRFDAAEMDSSLTGRLMARVYSAVAPEMPEFDIDAPAPVRHWQCRICRDFYLIHRREILRNLN